LSVNRKVERNDPLFALQKPPTVSSFFPSFAPFLFLCSGKLKQLKNNTVAYTYIRAHSTASGVPLGDTYSQRTRSTRERESSGWLFLSLFISVFKKKMFRFQVGMASAYFVPTYLKGGRKNNFGVQIYSF
jgi:hypothetical protein